jgi:hypothetical protein
LTAKLSVLTSGVFGLASALLRLSEPSVLCEDSKAGTEIGVLHLGHLTVFPNSFGEAVNRAEQPGQATLRFTESEAEEEFATDSGAAGIFNAVLHFGQLTDFPYSLRGALSFASQVEHLTFMEVFTRENKMDEF